MNKTITINLGSVNFYIDENAFHKLDRYLKSISASLDAESREETMQDIETRIAEIFLENQKKENEVISIPLVNKVIEVMGEPEDYQIDDDNEKHKQKTQYQKTSKKLYRDIEHKTIGGVCAGLSYYVGINRIWVRLIFLLLLFPGILSFRLMPGGSTILLIYIILWIIVPEARTTSQKLEMQGEKIDIDNIERKVREEYENVKNKVKNSDYSGFEKFLDALGKILLGVLKVVVIFIGITLVITGAICLILLPIELLFLGAINDISIIGIPYETLTSMPEWLSTILFLLLTGIPSFLLLMAGLKILSPKSRSIGLIGILVLIGIWVLSFIPFFYYSFNPLNLNYHKTIHTKASNKTTDTKTSELNLAKDTLYIQSLHQRNFDNMENETFTFEGDTYSKSVKLKIVSTSENPELSISKSFSYKSRLKTDISDFTYRSKFKNDTLYLDKVSSVFLPQKRVNYQHVNGEILLPKNIVFKIDKNLSGIFKNISSDMYNHFLILEDGHIKCLDCDRQ